MSSVISPSSSSSSPSSASALITSTGIGSGLDIGAIVSSLTTAFGAAQTSQLTNQQNTLDSEVSAYGTFTAALDTLQLSLPALEDPSQLAAFAATVADPTIASATTNSDAVAGTYSLQVDNLATVATATSAALSSTAPIGTGTLTIGVGSASTAITIDSTNDTLAGIAAEINSTPNVGVSASVITTTGGSRLVLTGTNTGAANQITVTPSGGDGGLASLALTTVPAQDANYEINGFAATSGSNVVANAITGVTLNLQKASAASTPTTLTISPDTTSAQTAIDKFVTAVNGVLSSIQTLTSYDPSTQTAGPLNGNATLEAFQNQLQSILGTFTNAGGGVKSLTDLGITAGTDGTYSSDDTTLGNALTASLASVGNLLGGANGIATQISTLVNNYTKPGGLLDTINQGLQTSLTNVSQQQTALAAQMAAYSARLTAEYNAMDTAVALLKQTQTYLNAEFNPSANAASGTSQSNTSLGSGTLGTSG
ncbi:MAG TPA: flagellar filament capping protein FliD [Steroidobacteraceae bacterium]|jgi:flagellar hook-associated protein 2|nr:flagellar filament capping protein FliD [Steroidobacteraceae bacterium]